MDKALDILTVLTPVLLAVIGYYAAKESRRADRKLNIIHTLVNDNLTQAKARELIALEAWALSMETHKEHDKEALADLKDRIRLLAREIEERDRVAAGIPQDKVPTSKRQ